MPALDSVIITEGRVQKVLISLGDGDFGSSVDVALQIEEGLFFYPKDYFIREGLKLRGKNFQGSKFTFNDIASLEGLPIYVLRDKQDPRQIIFGDWIVES